MDYGTGRNIAEIILGGRQDMNYLHVPEQITLKDIREKKVSLSPSMYRAVTIPTTTVKRVRDTLDTNNPFDEGIEPGSKWYLKHSTHHFIRTKALQEYSCLLYPKGDAIIPLNPKVFNHPNLCKGDILMSKDSNVGESAIIDDNHWDNHTFSSGLVRLHPLIDRYYFFSFIKHRIFKAQLLAMAARGATITHAKNLWLDCFIPFPNQKNAGDVISYVASLMQAIIDKESTIRKRDAAITHLINEELRLEQEIILPLIYAYPGIKEIREQGRLDAAIYDYEYKRKIHRILNYQHGIMSPREMGFIITPGPSLEIKVLRSRIDSDIPIPGFYTLILPANISEYGTMNRIQYLGTSKKLPLLKQGDIIFGEAGFQKGRSIVLVEPYENCTTNAHGLYARRHDADLVSSIFFRCIFNWYRNTHLVDIMAVGGSGGHFSPVYFDDYIRIPKFSREKQQEIASLYHNTIQPPNDILTLDNFVDWHHRWNAGLAVWELDREMKVLQRILADIQTQIIEGKTVILQI